MTKTTIPKSRPESGPEDGPVITFTEAAAGRIRALLAKAEEPAAGLRLSVSTEGCSGLAYRFDFAAGKSPGDDTVTLDGAVLFIDPGAIEYVSGAEMDYVEDRFNSGFVFRNPNEKGRCGCGESFYV